MADFVTKIHELFPGKIGQSVRKPNLAILKKVIVEKILDLPISWAC